MKTSTAVGVVAALLVAGGAWYWLGNGVVSEQTAAGHKNITYSIEGQPVTLVDGRAEIDVAPGAAAKVVTQYFGNEATGDLNGDGMPDIAFILTQDRGGSGTFYYVVAAVKTATGWQGTDAVLLGDRVAPQPTEIRDGEVIVNYVERAPGEPMTAEPSVGKSLWLKLDTATMQFGIVVQNFEGETDMSRLIQVSSPLPNAEVTSPLVVSGKAVGNWYFEASFPVVLVDWDGKIIAQGIATAQGDWMTTEFVPFIATLSFNTADISGQYSNRGTLILKKDNPSGLSEYDNAFEVPVILK